MFRFHFRILAIGVFLVSVGFVDAQNKYPALGKKTKAILHGASKVEVFKLTKNKKNNPPVFEAGFKRGILAAGVPQGAKYATKVGAILTAPATRKPSGASGFGPELGFRFWKRKESVSVMVDLDGMQFYLVTKDAKGKIIERNWGGLFDPQLGPSKQIQKLANKAFAKKAKKGK